MRARHARRHSGRLRVVVTDGRGRPVPSFELGPWLERAAPASARGTVSVALVADVSMRRLNREHRGTNRATDVLSFPSGPGLRVDGSRSPEPLLGDLAIATGVARRQARNHGHALGVELRILALHGLLHLLGYDHDADDGRMARAEARLGRRAGLPPALIARTSRRVVRP